MFDCKGRQELSSGWSVKLWEAEGVWLEVRERLPLGWNFKISVKFRSFFELQFKIVRK